MAAWRALGDAGPAGGTKARQKHIEAMRAKAWVFASKRGGRALQGEGWIWGHQAEKGRDNGDR